ncbi:oligosaccharide flippase family protein [Clostridium sp.]|uniref:oligosaccharide flippase family protein n=1 Tax=Clostridium sp. TaxID=1506 RepID=UPI001D36A6BD|nr:oligosaccharide flippase family protein [Clostridium sp.]MBS5937917.1 oligosaccharide flippase family protein [Clostridium sp.]
MQILKNFLYNLSYQILVLILPLITVPYVSKVLGAKGVGDYAFTFANTQYFILFGMVGVTLYGNRQIAYVRDNKEKLKNTFYSIYLVQLITMTISSVIFLIFTFTFTDKLYSFLYLAQGVNILASLIDISWLFMGLEQFKKTVVRNTIVKLVSLASIFIFVKGIDDLVVYTLILALANLLGNLTFWLYIPKTIGFEKIRVNALKVHLKASIALFIPQIAIQVYLLLSRTLLGIFTDTIQVGYYDNSQKLVKIALTVATAIGTVMMPKIANTVASGDMNKVKYYIKNSFFFMNFISVPLTFGVLGIAKELSPWFFGKEFEGIETLIIISCLIILAISWSNVFGTQLLVPLNKTKEFTLSVTAGAIVNLVLNLILLKVMGSIGACITTVLAEITVTITQMYILRKFLNMKELIKSVIIFFPAAILMFILVRVIGIAMGAQIVTTFAQVSIGGVFYLITLFILYKVIYKKNIIIYIKNMIKK